MTVQECYVKMGADYEGALGRLRKETLIRRFALKFLLDESYASLVRAIEEQDYDKAYQMAHTLKGTCANLSFTRLGGSAAELSDELRGRVVTEAVPALFSRVKEDYKVTIEALRELEAS